MAKEKINIRAILIEALLIVFTVTLALALNEWRTSVKEEKTRDTVLENIVKEIKYNIRELDRVMAHHKATSERFSLYLSSDSLWNTLQNQMGIDAMGQIMQEGIMNPYFQFGAWRSAELSGVINNFEYKTLYVLSNVYQLQESGPQSTWKAIATRFMDPNSYNKNNARQLAFMLQLAFGELYSQENTLKHSLENALEVLEQN